MSNDKVHLNNIITEYSKSIIQSEAEVRSKFIVPLTEYLGYPSELRAEEFPVHGFEGGKKIPAKNADYLFFTDKEFAKHRKFSRENQNWVYQHSLFVIEAKKPGEMPEVFGQPEFYTIWTRAVAYMITDGISVNGYYYNPINCDWKLLDSSVKDLPLHVELDEFSYQNILTIKQEHADVNLQMLINKNEENSYQLITNEEELELPSESFEFMRQELGEKARGLNNLQLTSLFLNSIDMYLQLGVRYDVPEIMFSIPRETFEACIYEGGMIFPIDRGMVDHFYWNDFERYHYESTYITAEFLLKSNRIVGFEAGYHVFDRFVSERLEGFKFVRKFFAVKNIRMQIDDRNNTSLMLDFSAQDYLWKGKEYSSSMMEFWIDNLEKMKVIEEYYMIKFKLKYVQGRDDLNILYDAIENVYNGICMQENCIFRVTSDFIEEDFEIKEPTLLQEGDIPLSDTTIHDVVFRPSKSVLLPVLIKKSDIADKDEIVSLPVSCLYDIVSGETVG